MMTGFSARCSTLCVFCDRVAIESTSIARIRATVVEVDTLLPARHERAEDPSFTSGLGLRRDQVREGCQRHDTRRLDGKFGIDGDEHIGLELRHREILGQKNRIPALR